MLATANRSISIADIAACKENTCITQSISLITDALNNGKARAEDVLNQRKEQQETITRFNFEVRRLYLSIDSLTDVYIRNKKEWEAYDQERKDFTEKYRFATVNTLASSNPSVTSTNLRTSSQANNSGVGTTNITRAQKEIDDHGLKDKKNRLTTEQQHLVAIKNALEKERQKLVKEGTYLNTQLKQNTTALHEVYTRMDEIVGFGNKADKIFSTNNFNQALAPELLKNCNALVEMLSTRVREADLLIDNPVNTRLKEVKI